MTLTATRHHLVRELIVVTNDDAQVDGNVVFRWNEKHRVGTRTVGHSGSKPSMRAIRTAIAAVQA